MKVQPTTKELIAMLYERLPELFDRAAPVQEPVAYLCENAVGHKYFRWKKPSSQFKPIALYTTPPAAQRTWVGLTDEEIEQEFGFIDELLRDCVYRTQAKLKEKNT